jgi:hypothetical protein
LAPTTMISAVRMLAHYTVKGKPDYNRASKICRNIPCFSFFQRRINHPITYYWTVPLILDHSYLVGK